MKIRNSIIAFLLFIGIAGDSVTLVAAPISFWVALDGNDGNSGDQDHPFLTIERARDAVRLINEDQRRDITIYIRDGTHRLTQPLVLDWRDSGQNGRYVIYRAAPDEHPVISGAVKVENWTLHDAALNIYKADVGANRSRQLYVNGQRATRAQTDPYPAGFRPNYDPVGASPNGGIQYIPNLLNPLEYADPALWKNPQQIEAVIITQWKMMRVPVDAVFPELILPAVIPGLITLQEPAWTNANVFVSYDETSHKYKPGIWSFWQVTRFENAYEFLSDPGEWYLDESNNTLYYIPRWGEDMDTADVELPVLETLVDGQGTLAQPICNIRFEGLTFSYATWMEPSTGDGYVSDQSGFHLVGNGHEPNIIGHDQNDERTPGNVKFIFARKIRFQDSLFEHLGAVGLDFNTGSQNNSIINNKFRDISSAGIQLGGIDIVDHHPNSPEQVTRDNLISNNLIYNTGVDYVDAAGIFVGFTTRTTISHNSIISVPWAGIAIGWGWGLLDPGSFPGAPGAIIGQWGNYDTPTTSCGNRILNNHIEDFLSVLWDGGAIYTLGRQGPSLAKGMLISGNVAFGKRANAGSNIFYTDGGSRYITLSNNVSYDNPRGNMDFGPAPNVLDPLPYSALPSLLNILPYGSDTGGCRTYGDIRYIGNYWLYPDFYSPCEYRDENGVSYPTNLSYRSNHVIQGESDVPQRILRAAGRRP